MHVAGKPLRSEAGEPLRNLLGKRNGEPLRNVAGKRAGGREPCQDRGPTRDIWYVTSPHRARDARQICHACKGIAALYCFVYVLRAYVPLLFEGRTLARMRRARSQLKTKQLIAYRARR